MYTTQTEPTAPARRRLAWTMTKVAAVLVVLVTLSSYVAQTSNSAFTSKTSAQMSAAAATNFYVNPVTTNLAWWLDASSTATLFSDVGCTTPSTVGGSVRCWRDRRGTNSITTSGTAPTRASATLNGKNPVFFSGTGVLAGADLFGGSTNSVTIFMVTREVSRQNTVLLSIDGTNFTASRRFTISPWSTGAVFFDAGSTSNRVNSISNVTSVGTVTLWSAWQDPVAGVNRLNVNRTLQYSAPPVSSGLTSGGLRIGDAVPGNTPNHQVAEVLIYTRTLTTAEITAVENYLHGKWATP